MLYHRNMPIVTGLSPAQMMIGCCCKSRLFTRHELLLMSNSHQLAVHEKHLLSKEKSRECHN